MTGDRSDTDLRRVRALAVHTDDVLDALEARERSGTNVVLRTLPPFSGRMRARLHVVEGASGDMEPGAVHFHPGVFVDSVPPYPRVDDTADELRDEGAYDVAVHRERHERAVAEWRETVRSRRREALVLSDPSWSEASVTLRVNYLG